VTSSCATIPAIAIIAYDNNNNNNNNNNNDDDDDVDNDDHDDNGDNNGDSDGDNDGDDDDHEDVILTRRPLFSSFVFIVTLSLSVFGIKPRGSKLRSPGIWSAFNVATPTCGIGPHPAPLLLIIN